MGQLTLGGDGVDDCEDDCEDGTEDDGEHVCRVDGDEDEDEAAVVRVSQHSTSKVAGKAK